MVRHAERQPAFVVPMLASKVSAPFSHAGWLFEPKWAGFISHDATLAECDPSSAPGLSDDV